MANTNEDSVIYQPSDYQNEFNPHAYLNHFYSREATEKGLKIALFTLPNFAERIPLKNAKLLDIGSGPTIYVALCFRSIADSIVLTDYTDSSREELHKWLNGTSNFDWLPVIKSVGTAEGVQPRQIVWQEMEEICRSNVKHIWPCDVHEKYVLGIECPEKQQGKYDIITSIFCFESACRTIKEYETAMKNVVGLLKPGGYFILISVTEDTEYSYANDKFSLLYLTVDDILETMEKVGIDTCDRCGVQYEHDGAFMILARKK